MAVVWTELLSVGIDRIDEQHKKWFEHADRLFEAGKTGKSKEVIGELLGFLDQYTKTHFADEEKYMASINYPYIAEQQRYHAEFIKSLAKLKDDFDKSGGNLTVIITANKLVIDWLTNHISVVDKKIGKFVRGELK